ncbi:MAG: hypothetical protein Q7U69_00825 [Sulfuricurvum sp.]|uniref:5'-methylthioadenosine/S-adenosylhomocysteine nucleosidase family protein n=1 Tax=Sulfuricurvum sp. TaxID=2025608 RepID=UPI00271CB6D2|nr:hypothetical protein [Sulfuricurvum sp.]MDO9055066.1 hypothetical protein [Sulfuricurvum sp.]
MFKCHQNTILEFNMNYDEKRIIEIEDILKNNGLPLIVTATDTETDAIHNKMVNLDGYPYIIKFYNNDHTYYMGKLGNYIIVHIQCEMGAIGRSSSIITVTEAISTINPRFVLMIGIAFGINKQKQNIGDVLVSESIIPYNTKRVGRENTIQRGKQGLSNKFLLNKFKNIKSWIYPLECGADAKIIFTDLLSGEELVDNKEHRNQLISNFPSAEGGEMEGAGVFAACDNKVPWILVKGICDFADGNKGKNKKLYQNIAMNAALNLCMELFNSEIVFEELGVNPIKIKKLDEEKCLSFEEARDIARSLKLKSKRLWNAYSLSQGKDDRLPLLPDKVYENHGWINWNDWLGIETKKQKFLEFELAKEFVISLNLQKKTDWDGYCKGQWPSLPDKPTNIPIDPDRKYIGWKSWNDWLTGKDKIMDFAEARAFVRKLGLKGQLEWKKYTQGKLNGYQTKPIDIPSSPDVVYSEYINIADWLGYKGKIKPKKGANLLDHWWPFEEARSFARKLGLKTSSEWIDYCEGKYPNLPPKPTPIPKQPSATYKNYGTDWISWADWLGDSSKNKTKVKDALPFEEARKYIRSLNLKSTKEWEEYKTGKLQNLAPIPKNIPKSPSSYYKDNGWISIPDWLGY